jgi:hypothetical protein
MITQTFARSTTGKPFFILILGCLLAPVRPAAAASVHSAWGVAVGWPQVVAVTGEWRREGAAVGIQCHAGTLVLVSSAGIRAVVVPSREGIAPYLYLGGGILHIAEGESGGGVGLTGYGWGGVGARLRHGRVTWFAELGVLGGMDTSKGYESWLPCGAIGIAFGGAGNAGQTGR